MDATEQEQQWAEEHQIPDLGLSQVGLTNDEVDELERAAWIAAAGDTAMLAEAAQVVLRLGLRDNDRIREAGGIFFRALDCYLMGDWSTWPHGIGATGSNAQRAPGSHGRVLSCPGCGELLGLSQAELIGRSLPVPCYYCGRVYDPASLLADDAVATNE